MMEDVLKEFRRIIYSKEKRPDTDIRVEYIQKNIFGNSFDTAKRIEKMGIEHMISFYDLAICHNLIYYFNEKFSLNIEIDNLIKIMEAVLLVGTMYSNNITSVTVSIISGLYHNISICRNDIDYVVRKTNQLIGVDANET